MADKKQIDPRRPIPASGYDLLRKNLKSGFAEGFPVIDFPNPDNRPNINRGRITTRKDDDVKDISIGLQDHDEAIMHYFNEVIKPTVIINGDRTPVPIVYGAPERWKGVQKDGFYRDKEGKIQVPLIMFKRDRVEKRRDLGNKIDGNNPQLYYTFQEKYTRRNQYDNFSVLQNRMPQREFHAVVVPDFVKLTYSCIIWCDYVAQMNKLVEMINYTSDSYWGDPERFKFNAKIDSYDNRTEVVQGDNRIVKTSFGLTLLGYLVPDSLNKELSKKPQKFFSKSTVVFNNELSLEPSGTPMTRDEIRDTVPTHIPESIPEAQTTSNDGVVTSLESEAVSAGVGTEELGNISPQLGGGIESNDVGTDFIIQGDIQQSLVFNILGNYPNIGKAQITLSYAVVTQDPDTFISTTEIQTTTFVSTTSAAIYNAAFDDPTSIGSSIIGADSSGKYFFYTGNEVGALNSGTYGTPWQTLQVAVNFMAPTKDHMDLDFNFGGENIKVTITQNVADSSLVLPVTTNSDFLSLCSDSGVPSAFS